MPASLCMRCCALNFLVPLVTEANDERHDIVCSCQGFPYHVTTELSHYRTTSRIEYNSVIKFYKPRLDVNRSGGSRDPPAGQAPRYRT